MMKGNPIQTFKQRLDAFMHGKGILLATYLQELFCVHRLAFCSLLMSLCIVLYSCELIYMKGGMEEERGR